MPWSLSAHDVADNAADRARLGRLRIVWAGEVRWRGPLQGQCPIPASYGRRGLAGGRHDAEHHDPGRQPVQRGRGRPGRRAALPGGGQQGPPLRRRVLHRGDLDGHLLPPVLPGDHAETREHAVLPQRGGGPGGGLPGLQAVPPGRLPRLARVEHPGRHGGPRDAADRRRRGRPGRRRGPGQPARLRAAPGAPPGHRRTGRGPARHRPRAAGADGAHPGRDHRAAAVRDRLRGRLRQHQAVQRDHPRGLRGDADPAARGARRRAAPDPAAADPAAAAAGPGATRRRRA